jgi:hypothetical protein
LWKPPAALGATSAVYDTLRSPLENNFTAGAPTTCVESNGTNGETPDTTLPTPGNVLHYLIRVENNCPTNNTNMGYKSDGTPRTGRTCP